MSTTKTISVISLAALGLLLGWWLWPKPSEAPSVAKVPTTTPEQANACPNFSQGRLTINQTTFNIGFARTREAKEQGLSGCPELPPDTGLVFPFDPPKQARFWMKDMLIPIDIIWIKDSKIIGIEPNLPIPSGQPGSTDLPIYQSPSLVDMVLEVPAGTTDAHGFRVGDSVTIQE